MTHFNDKNKGDTFGTTELLPKEASESVEVVEGNTFKAVDGDTNERASEASTKFRTSLVCRLRLLLRGEKKEGGGMGKATTSEELFVAGAPLPSELDDEEAFEGVLYIGLTSAAGAAVIRLLKPCTPLLLPLLLPEVSFTYPARDINVRVIR